MNIHAYGNWKGSERIEAQNDHTRMELNLFCVTFALSESAFKYCRVHIFNVFHFIEEIYILSTTIDIFNPIFNAYQTKYVDCKYLVSYCICVDD